MDTTYRPFELKRFFLTLKHDFVTERRSLAGKMLAMLGVFILLNLLFAYVFNEIGSDALNAGSIARSVTNYIVASVFWALGASCVTANMTSPRKRINAIMLPASHMEKYFTRILIWCVGTGVISLLCVELSDLVVRALYRGTPALSNWPMFTGMFQADMKMNGFMLFTTVLMSMGIYTLGATFWPKNAFLKTFLFQMIAQLVFSLLLTAMVSSLQNEIMAAIAENATMLDGHNSLIRLPQIWSMIPWLQLFISLFCFTVGYFRMRESEVIERM